MTPQRAYTQLKSLLPQLIDSCMPTNHSLLPYLRLAFVLTQLVFFFSFKDKILWVVAGIGGPGARKGVWGRLGFKEEGFLK